MRHDSAVDEHSWHKRTEPALVVASFAYLVAYSWRVIADLQGPARLVATVVVLVTWAMFILDYLVRLALADDRRRWFRTHLPALAFALIPVLRLVLLLRVLTRIPGMHTSAGGALRLRILVYGAGASVILVYIATLAVLEAERYAPDADITSFGIALWWACVTVTTTGYGDYTPVTAAGRWVGVGLMLGGVALAGVITATLASWVLERAARDRDDQEPATRAQVRALMARIEELAAQSGGSAAPTAGGAPGEPPRHAGGRHPESPAPAEGWGPAGGAGGGRHHPDGIGDGGDDRPGG